MALDRPRPGRIGRRTARRRSTALPPTAAASVVIPNWNGRDLLEKYLPSVVEALAGNPDNEIDRGGQRLHRRQRRIPAAAFPRREACSRCPAISGFGGGSNAGFRAARNDIVVLLNSDMRVDAGFSRAAARRLRRPRGLRRLLPDLLQRSRQAPRGDRADAGLVAGRRAARAPPHRRRASTDLFPCFYGGGGSCAFDRRKFLELGGFDHLLAPFYLEDTDLGYMAWKRGWKVLYQPRSVVYHEHRGTIGKKFSHGLHPGGAEEELPAVLLEEHPRVAAPAARTSSSPGRARCSAWSSATSPGVRISRALWRAFRAIAAARCGRAGGRARLARIDDTRSVPPAAGRLLPRPLRTRCRPRPSGCACCSSRPYPICPPVHGGGVFMYQTLRELAKLADVHVVELLD